MYENINKFIRELSEIYDSNSKNYFVSVYFNKNSDKNFIEKRIKTCRAVMKNSEQKNFKKRDEGRDFM